jgi:hypothetical protein
MFNRSNTRTIVYLQNSGFLNGNILNSVILSCKGNHNETEDMVKHASSFIERNHITYPIFWNELMERNVNFYKNSGGDVISNKFKDECMVVGQLKFQGPHLYGGKSSDKFFQNASLTTDFLPVSMPKKMNIIMSTCKFDEKHVCDVQTWKGSVDDIKNYQRIITKMITQREIEKWNTTSHKNKPEILLQLSKIKKETENETM